MTKIINFSTSACMALFFCFAFCEASHNNKYMPLGSKDTAAAQESASAEEELAQIATDSFENVSDLISWLNDKTKKWSGDNLVYRMKVTDISNALIKYSNKPKNKDNGYELGNLLTQAYLLKTYSPGCADMHIEEFRLIRAVLLKSLNKLQLPPKRTGRSSKKEYKPQDLLNALEKEMICIRNHHQDRLDTFGANGLNMLNRNEQLTEEDYKESGIKDVLERTDTPPAEVLVRTALEKC